MRIASVDVPRIAVTLFIFDFVILLAMTGLPHIVVSWLGLDGLLVEWTEFQFTPLLGLAGAMAYSFSVLVILFVLGLYQRNYMHSTQLFRSTFVSACVIGVIFSWLIDTFSLAYGNASDIDLFIRHVTIFAIVGFSRPAFCKLYESFVRKTRMALVGSESMISGISAVTARVMPSDFVVVNNVSIDCSSNHGRLKQEVDELLTRKDVDQVVVDLLPQEVNTLFAQQMHTDASSILNRVVGRSSIVERFARWSDLLDEGRLRDTLASHATLRSVKYAVERFLALIGIVCTLPAMAAVAIAIKLEDGGPIFYRQPRLGENNRVFDVLKFRSMIQNAEADGQAQWAAVKDSRVTRVGNFIRLTRLDELPQLINIAKGEMALVGPRPERPEIVKELKREIPGYELRHLVRPGLTGWAQINLPYSSDLESTFRKTEFDHYYIKYWSPFLDLAILAQTIRVVLFAEGSR